MDIQLEKKKGLKPIHYLYLGGIVVLLLLLYKIFFGDHLSTLRVNRDEITINQISNGKFDDYIMISGSAAPIATVFMDAYEGGRVVKKYMEEGEMVKKGDVILKLENQNLYEQILNSESNLSLKQNDLRSTRIDFDTKEVEGKKSLATAEINLQKAKRKFHQNKSLYDDDLIAKEQYLIAKEDLELAQKQYDISNYQVEQDAALRKTSLSKLETDLERMQKTLSMVYERLDHLNVKAPADGQLAGVDVEIGQTINQGTPLGQINILSGYKIEAYIDEHYIDKVVIGLRGSLTQNHKEYQLKIKKIYPEVKEGQFKVDFIFVGATPKRIKTGQNYSINLKLGSPSNALLLAKGGFFQNTGGQWVYVINSAADFATKRYIQLGKQNAEYYQVTEGLKQGDLVITSSYDNFGDVDKLILN
ncbi:efflux RND transporter periplasmic adaptor subunit [Zhouia sp. PK063]|uniref:efflux RND transporter periplasmic adaptor subunit n=1 Tax=Zhouia sp. PK063 TaxID=3373602 RepID=UPI0037B4384F